MLFSNKQQTIEEEIKYFFYCSGVIYISVTYLLEIGRHIFNKQPLTQQTNQDTHIPQIVTETEYKNIQRLSRLLNAGRTLKEMGDNYDKIIRHRKENLKLFWRIAHHFCAYFVSYSEVG